MSLLHSAYVLLSPGLLRKGFAVSVSAPCLYVCLEEIYNSRFAFRLPSSHLPPAFLLPSSRLAPLLHPSHCILACLPCIQMEGRGRRRSQAVPLPSAAARRHRPPTQSHRPVLVRTHAAPRDALLGTRACLLYDLAVPIKVREGTCTLGCCSISTWTLSACACMPKARLNVHELALLSVCLTI